MLVNLRNSIFCRKDLQLDALSPTYFFLPFNKDRLIGTCTYSLSLHSCQGWDLDLKHFDFADVQIKINDFICLWKSTEIPSRPTLLWQYLEDMNIEWPTIGVTPGLDQNHWQRYKWRRQNFVAHVPSRLECISQGFLDNNIYTWRGNYLIDHM